MRDWLLAVVGRAVFRRKRDCRVGARCKRGFSLLEILLALAILGGSLAVLSTISDTGIDAAMESRDLAVARILCQTKLSEMLLQDVSPQSVPSTPIASTDSGSLTPFAYSVEVLPAPMDGLLVVRVTVEANPSESGAASVTYALTRWMIDPALGLEEAEAAEKAAAEEAAAAAEADTSEGGGI
ncbi:prepilin-type N-terminal cleavage/methylation domain-containing protein [Novipirellula artificiosorum]|uniref:Prepilin-type N-terminal cleavage/methylation domain-containing protein n=1 Tax=Novipirellula artificiosorum TaxID=2528016 RepID=A0A5C6DWU5_9BACT|nr:prepilin-type N-terminal cleavage/methylation domain-containing protein [Novipirellula artificiosorum]TWU41903.1 hypothetical protein Poly41_01960 [Novipirellula artificiosorum]